MAKAKPILSERNKFNQRPGQERAWNCGISQPRGIEKKLKRLDTQLREKHNGASAFSIQQVGPFLHKKTLTLYLGLGVVNAQCSLYTAHCPLPIELRKSLRNMQNFGRTEF